MAQPFEFKQFSLRQSKSAFKLGTDSVILGSWLPGTNFQRVLDIGSGTGILALMMAQRFIPSGILAVELDVDSTDDCANNFQHSKWADQLSIVNMNILDWSAQNKNEKFDLIITNPPYFVDSLKNPDSRKSSARHTHLLGLEHLSELVFSHLSLNGSFAFILPVLQFDQLEKLLAEKNMFPTNICKVSSYSGSEAIRKLGVFGFNKNMPVVEHHFLYNDDKTRSDWYKSISNDFYIR